MSDARRRRRPLVGAVVGLAIVLGVAELWAGHSGHRRGLSVGLGGLRPGAPIAAPAAPVRAPAAPIAASSFRAHFAVLGTRGGRGGGLPPASRAVLAGSTSPSFDDGDLAAARRVPSVTPAWLVPARASGELCLVRLVYALVRGPGGRALPPSTELLCAPLRVARLGGLAATQSMSATAGGSRFSVVGVVADGVRDVTIASADGRRRTVAVRANAYAATVPDPVAVTLTAPFDGRLLTRTVALETPHVG